MPKRNPRLQAAVKQKFCGSAKQAFASKRLAEKS
jgi:hypothetical protein